MAKRVPQRGEIWLVEFNPRAGSEIEKPRPAIVISSDLYGKLPLRIVVPLTDNARNRTESWFVPIPADRTNRLKKDSTADCFQCMALSLVRFVKYIGTVSPEQLHEIVLGVGLCIEHP